MDGSRRLLGLKIKLIGSLVAISAILLLKDFVNIGNPTARTVDYHAVGWRIGIHLTFVFSGLVFAIMDYWGAKRLKVLAELHSPDAAALGGRALRPSRVLTSVPTNLTSLSPCTSRR